jgi:hypothetical protein
MKETTQRYKMLQGKLRAANEKLSLRKIDEDYIAAAERKMYEAMADRDDLAQENSALKRRIAELEWMLNNRNAPPAADVKQLWIESSSTIDVDFTTLTGKG